MSVITPVILRSCGQIVLMVCSKSPSQHTRKVKITLSSPKRALVVVDQLLAPLMLGASIVFTIGVENSAALYEMAMFMFLLCLKPADIDIAEPKYQ